MQFLKPHVFTTHTQKSRSVLTECVLIKGFKQTLSLSFSDVRVWSWLLKHLSTHHYSYYMNSEHTSSTEACRDIISVWLLTGEWRRGSDLSGWNVSSLLHSRSCWASPLNFDLLFLFHHLFLFLWDKTGGQRCGTAVSSDNKDSTSTSG